MAKKSIAKRVIMGTLLTSACAYAVTFGVMAGFGRAEALTVSPSSECHAATDDVGATLQNSGALTYTGTASTIKIYCPAGFGVFAGGNVTVYGNEGTDGSTSRNCFCAVGPISCACAAGKSWVNGSLGVVASGLDTFGGPREQTFGYVLHMMTPNSSLAGMTIGP